mmetsp:Transcript_14005/g.33902  ORF Transcript_14005/g.33902 Transcript_14005/m.33902 type:complete len:200 (-) Transcript_14005:572-1171(-)
MCAERVARRGPDVAGVAGGPRGCVERAVASVGIWADISRGVSNCVLGAGVPRRRRRWKRSTGAHAGGGDHGGGRRPRGQGSAHLRRRYPALRGAAGGPECGVLLDQVGVLGGAGGCVLCSVRCGGGSATHSAPRPTPGAPRVLPLCRRAPCAVRRRDRGGAVHRGGRQVGLLRGGAVQRRVLRRISAAPVRDLFARLFP